MFVPRLRSVKLLHPIPLAHPSFVPRTVVRGYFLSSSTPCKRKAFEGLAPRVPFPIRYKSIGASIALSQSMSETNGSGMEQIQMLDGIQDSYGGVIVEMKEHMDADIFAPLLRASISSWTQLGKKGVWIKLPIEYSHLVDIIVKEGFRYHHAEPNYLMLVRWLAQTPDTIPVNASHRVGVGAFVLNYNREVLVVQEHSGRFQGTGVWKLPTGVVNEGEDICHAVVREVKEETGVEAKFVEVLCFRQSHKSFFTKSDLLFLCVLHPESFVINKQNAEIEAARWMPIEEYAAQPFIVGNKQFNFMAKICLEKADHSHPGFAASATTTGRGKRTYIYCNNPGIVENSDTST